MASSKKEEPIVELDDDSVAAAYSRFLKDKELIGLATKRLEQNKAALMAYAERNGITDDGGHQWVDLDDGTFKRQVSRIVTPNVERMRAWLEEVGRLEDVEYEKTIVYWDEDAFWTVVDEEELTPEEIDAFDDVTLRYSFIPGATHEA